MTPEKTNKLAELIEYFREHDIPVINMNDDNFEKKLDFALNTTGSSSDYRNDRDRPYNGQPHTDFGTRGKQAISGLTMRDMMDCFVKGWLYSIGNLELSERIERNEWRYADVYKYDGTIDPIAVAQNMLVEVEKMMEIFPNIKENENDAQAK